MTRWTGTTDPRRKNGSRAAAQKKKKTTVSIAVHNRGLRGENGESGAGFTNIILRQQVGTELQVVVQIK